MWFFPLSLKVIVMFWFKNVISAPRGVCVCVCVCVRVHIWNIHISSCLDAVVDKWGGVRNSGWSWPSDSGSEPRVKASLPYTFCPCGFVWPRKSMTDSVRAVWCPHPCGQEKKKRANLSGDMNSKSVARRLITVSSDWALIFPTCTSQRAFSRFLQNVTRSIISRYPFKSDQIRSDHRTLHSVGEVLWLERSAWFFLSSQAQKQLLQKQVEADFPLGRSKNTLCLRSGLLHACNRWRPSWLMKTSPATDSLLMTELPPILD